MNLEIAIDEATLPATLKAQPMTDDEFAGFCAEHPDLRIEATAEGEIILMAPSFSWTGARNSRITSCLDAWARQDGRGIAGDSNTGFVLPNGARRSPGASWTLKSRVKKFGRTGFWHLCPDFAIELQSESDRLTTLRAKMREYIANGAQLGWLIDPDNRTVEAYRPDGSVEKHPGIGRIEGEGPVAGFVLDLGYIWNPFED